MRDGDLKTNEKYTITVFATNYTPYLGEIVLMLPVLLLHYYQLWEHIQSQILQIVSLA